MYSQSFRMWIGDPPWNTRLLGHLAAQLRLCRRCMPLPFLMAARLGFASHSLPFCCDRRCSTHVPMYIQLGIRTHSQAYQYDGGASTFSSGDSHDHAFMRKPGQKTSVFEAEDHPIMLTIIMMMVCASPNTKVPIPRYSFPMAHPYPGVPEPCFITVRAPSICIYPWLMHNMRHH